MTRVALKSFSVVGLSLLLLAAGMKSSKDEITTKVVLVDVAVKSPAEVTKCTGTSLDVKSITLNVEFDDTLNNLEDLTLEEDPIEGPGCFMPDTKIIYKDYTYIFSIYCTSVQKYKNLAPFTPSTTKVSCDISVTESMVDYLIAVRKKYFGAKVNTTYASSFYKPTPLPQDEKVDDSDLYKEDDKDDDSIIENDGNDPNGWFDETPKPEDDLDKNVENDDMNRD